MQHATEYKKEEQGMIFIIAKIYEGLKLMDSIEIEKFAVCLCFGKKLETL